MKTTKHFVMVALALMTAACNKVDIKLDQQPANDEITITATIDANDGAITRALSIDGSNIASTWEASDQFAILFNDGSSDIKRVATVDKIDGTTVTITFTIPSSLASNTACTIVYPASAANAANTGADVATALTTQDGTIGNCPEVRVGTATIDKENHNLTSVTKLAAQNTIFKFTVQDLSAVDKTATEFKVSDGSGTVLTTVTPAPATGTLYVALPEMAAGTYWFTATIDDKAYVAKATTAAATTAGKYYQTKVKMATCGNVIASDGKFYVNNAATPGGNTALAMITYVGDETAEASPYNHGLALALSDANSGSECAWTTSSGSTIHTYTTSSSTFASESGLQYNATQNTDTYPPFKYAIANNGTAAPTGCSAWFLASGYQWDQMITTTGSYTALRDGFSSVGGTNMQNINYWSSTEYGDPYYAWTYYFFSGYGGGKWAVKSKTEGFYVRSALAF